MTGISIYYSVQGRQVSAYSGDAPNTSSVRQEVFALPDSNSKVSDGATGESSGTSKNSAISAEQNTGVPTSPNVVPPSLPSAPDTANPPATEPPPQEPEETGSIIEWDVIVADLEIFTRTANEAIGKVSKFESDPDKGGIDQQNVDSLFVFLVKNKKSLTTTISRDKKTLGILGDYSSEKKVLLFDTGKQTQFIDLLKDESLKGIEVGVKKKTIDKPIKEIL